MENPSFYFWVGLAIGAVVGVATAFLYGKIRGFFANSEVTRLRQENRTLKQRLEKNFHTEQKLHE